MKRRDFVMGGAFAAAAGASVWLVPRRHTTLLHDEKIDTAVPMSFPGWTAMPSEGLVKPKVDGLAASLYNQILQRAYASASADAEAMLLIAYGGIQSDLLQLHRPEVCYPALGFQIESKVDAALALPGGAASLPVARVVAVSGERRENIVYWTRVGEDLPTSGRAQRTVLLRDAMEGFIPDGVLVRASIVSEDSARAFRLLDTFVPELLVAMASKSRAVLVGTQRANSLRAFTA